MTQDLRGALHFGYDAFPSRRRFSRRPPLMVNFQTFDDSPDDQFDVDAEAPPREHSPTDVESWLRLAFVNLPANRCHSLLQVWKHPRHALEAALAGREAELLATPGVTPSTVERLREAATRDLHPALEAMQTHAIRLLLEGEADYPEGLTDIPSPPPYLWMRGTMEESDRVAVAIVGTRHASEYGRGIAEKLAIDLARSGVTVVSGLARGIDTHAHKGALEGGGRTFAVCGCGLDIVYPLENKGLMQRIEENGAVFSEFAPTVHPEPWHFPARNRIISGLSVGTIVVEAGERSGALITSDFAMEQGRDVFAVPGNIHRAQSRGAHALIKQGATLVENAEDVMNALNNRALPFRDASQKDKSKAQKLTAPQVRPDLTAEQNRVFLALDAEGRHIDEVAARAQMGAAEVNATLVVLELKGITRRAAGGMFSRIDA